jgi:hypothetical protein
MIAAKPTQIEVNTVDIRVDHLEAGDLFLNPHFELARFVRREPYTNSKGDRGWVVWTSTNDGFHYGYHGRVDGVVLG